MEEEYLRNLVSIKHWMRFSWVDFTFMVGLWYSYHLINGGIVLTSTCFVLLENLMSETRGWKPTQRKLKMVSRGNHFFSDWIMCFASFFVSLVIFISHTIFMNLLSFRSPTLAAVQDLVISEVQQRKLLFVLHSDGNLRVWDLLSRGKIFSHAMTIPTLTGKYPIWFTIF